MSRGEQLNNDPFHVDQLILDYDYLVYRIRDHISSVHVETTNVCRRQHELITKGIVEEVVHKNIEELGDILNKSKELEEYFTQLNAIDAIVASFHERVEDIIKQLRDIKVHNINILKESSTTM